MKKKDKQSKQYRIFNKSTNTWFDVPEDQYRKYDRHVSSLRKRMQYHHHECFCTKKNFLALRRCVRTVLSTGRLLYPSVLPCLMAKAPLRITSHAMHRHLKKSCLTGSL